MTFKHCRQIILQDLRKVASHNVDKKLYYFIIRYLITNTSFKYTFWYRVSSYLKNVKIAKFLFPFAFIMYKHYTLKYGIQIPLGTNIGGGLSFHHFGTIIINGKSIIGENCTIFHGVTLGLKLGGKNEGTPIIGNGCVLGPGCKIIGNVKIGDFVFIGPIVLSHITLTTIVVAVVYLQRL